MARDFADGEELFRLRIEQTVTIDGIETEHVSTQGPYQKLGTARQQRSERLSRGSRQNRWSGLRYAPGVTVTESVSIERTVLAWEAFE